MRRGFILVVALAVFTGFFAFSQDIEQSASVAASGLEVDGAVPVFEDLVLNENESDSIDFASLEAAALDRAREFESRRLSVSLVNNLRPAREMDQYEKQWYSQLYDMSDPNDITQDWVAYQGELELSKKEFLGLAGDDDTLQRLKEAEERIKARHKAGWIWIASGAGALVAGVVMVLVNSSLSESIGALNGVGIGLAAVSFVPIVIGILNVRYDETPEVSADMALTMAEDYNVRLEDELRAGV